MLVDFWAEWCGPCKQIAPGLEQIADELAGKVTIAKVNIEESPHARRRYGVRGIPTMMLFKDGQMASMKVGAMPKQKILDWLDERDLTAGRLRHHGGVLRDAAVFVPPVSSARFPARPGPRRRDRASRR